MKLGLGTVQFGLDYGISNNDGITTEDEAAKIIDVATSHGISVIDTASLYGTSEQALGNILPKDHGFRIVTKTPRCAQEASAAENAQLVETALLYSLDRLQVDSVYGLLVHHTDDILSDVGSMVFGRMVMLREKGLVRKIGASVYTASQIDALLKQYCIDIIQIPLNVFDQRLITSGHISKLSKAGIEIHVRSAFLQGLLLMNPETLPPFFAPAKEHLASFQGACRKCGLSPIQGALGFLMSIPEINAVICGVNNHQQLEELCAAADVVSSLDYASFALDNEMILNPALWKM